METWTQRKWLSGIAKTVLLFGVVAALLQTTPGAAAQSAPSSCTQYYTVQAGDLCYLIAQKFALTLQQFYNLNPSLVCADLYVGEAVCVGLAPDRSTCGKLYNLQEGDSCASITRAFHFSPSTFAFLNPQLNCSSLPKLGQPICVSPCEKFLAPAPAPAPAAGNVKARKLAVESWGKKKKVLIDYLGATGLPIALKKIPIRDTVEQVFILSFAQDTDIQGRTQNGVFRPDWLGTITPDSVAAFKAANPGVKVTVSLAGYSQYVNANYTQLMYWYSPKDLKLWVKNAVESLTNITKTYHLDGIDIDYETFNQSSTFPYAIGEVIKTLKESKTINFATVAPYHRSIVPYKQLLRIYGDYIDYVNYQFYASDFTTVETFVHGYNNVARTFPREKLLPSTEVGGRGLQGQDFFSALEVLNQQSGGIPGMFLWSADTSYLSSFVVEKTFQCGF